MILSGKNTLCRALSMAVAGVAAIGYVGLLLMDFIAINALHRSVFVLPLRCTYPLVEDQMYHFFVSAPVTKVGKIGHTECALVDAQTLVC